MINNNWQLGTKALQGCCVAIDFVARAKSGILSNTPKRTVQGDTRGDEERGFIGKGCWARGSGVKEPRKTALPHGPQSHVLCCWHQFPGCLWPVTLTQGPSWWCARHSAHRDSSEEDSRRLVGYMGWSFLSPLTFPGFFQLMVTFQFHNPYQDLLFKITHTSGYHGAWSRQAIFPLNSQCFP